MTEHGQVKVIKGDLFEHQGTIFAHGVNCAGAMGAGIAVHFKNRYPHMYKEYRKSCHDGKIILGQAWRWPGADGEPFMTSQGLIRERSDPVVYNLAIKSHWRNPASYLAIESSVKEMLDSMAANHGRVVAMPWIGCGLGGLDQAHVKKILQRCLKNRPDFQIWVYEK